MRPRRHLAALAIAALVAVPACDAGGDAAMPPLTPADAVPASVPVEPTAQLCDALPGEVVAEATGRAPVTVDGAGTQCSWRAGDDRGGGGELVLQGSFIDATSFELGRPDDATTATVPGLGDDAYVVRGGGEAPTTLYVRHGSRALALWSTEPGAAALEASLADLARQVLAS